MRPKQTCATLALTLVLALAFSPGCSDDDNPAAPAGNNDGMANGGGDGGTAITSSNVAMVGAQATAVLATVPQTPGTHEGAGGGTVTVSISVGKVTTQDLNLSLSYVFDGYSNDGQLFYDGTISYSVTGSATSPNVSYQGSLTMSGTYSGTVDFDIQLANGVPSGSYTVNGQSVTI